MPRYRVIPYRAGSRSATSLSRALNGLCVRLNGRSRFRPRPDDVIINWGNTDPPIAPNRNGCDLRQVSNKLNFFNLIRDSERGDIIPSFWTNPNDIPDDVFEGDGRVVCRTVLAGHSGEGIIIANTREELVDAPLYVEYIKKQEEYRVHVGKTYEPILRAGERTTTRVVPNFSIISGQRKARRLDVETPDWQVRNHANGFIYARENLNPPDCVLEVAKLALQATDLDFGAVDVIYNQHYDRAYVLEINTAPGLEGQTVEDYANFFRVN